MISTRMSIGLRTVTIVTVLVFVSVVYMLRTDAIGFTFATGSGQGGLELKIDSKTYYNGVLQPTLTWALKDLVPGTDRFFKFLDVKPGDRGTSTISIHIKKNPAWVCLDFLNLKDKENGNNEPESHEDVNGAAGGELSSALEFFAWFDDGDNKYEIGEKALFGTTTQKATTTLRGTSYAIADYTHGPAIAVNQTKYIGITWCAGNLTVNTALAQVTCDGEVLGNGVQTDSMTVDVSFRAVSKSDDPKFMCVKAPKPPKPTCDAENGNNGHGNDEDRNDNSNPGKSNSTTDNTDDDGYPGNKNSGSHNDDCDDGHSGNGGSHGHDDNDNNDDYDHDWHPKPKPHVVVWNACKDFGKKVASTFRNGFHS